MRVFLKELFPRRKCADWYDSHVWHSWGILHRCISSKMICLWQKGRVSLSISKNFAHLHTFFPCRQKKFFDEQLIPVCTPHGRHQLDFLSDDGRSTSDLLLHPTETTNPDQNRTRNQLWGWGVETVDRRKSEKKNMLPLTCSQTSPELKKGGLFL